LLRRAHQLEGIDAASKPLVERLASSAVELNDLGAEFPTQPAAPIRSGAGGGLTAKMNSGSS